MRIPQHGKDRELLSRFAAPGRCQFPPCGQWCPHGRDPAHVFAVGLGGGHRIDHVYNLVSLCRCCHSASHAGKEPTQADLLAIVARREGTTAHDVWEWIQLVKMLSKGSPVPLLRRIPGELDATKNEVPF